ncbi:hypothetical protein DFJ74DRAFT_101440, partial [Hyaloraphidium curvatum]
MAETTWRATLPAAAVPVPARGALKRWQADGSPNPVSESVLSVSSSLANQVQLLRNGSRMSPLGGGHFCGAGGAALPENRLASSPKMKNPFAPSSAGFLSPVPAPPCAWLPRRVGISALPVAVRRNSSARSERKISVGGGETGEAGPDDWGWESGILRGPGGAAGVAIAAEGPMRLGDRKRCPMNKYERRRRPAAACRAADGEGWMGVRFR